MKAALGVVVPPRCPGCGASVAAEGGLCPDCWREAEFIGACACATCGVPLPGDGTEAGLRLALSYVVAAGIVIPAAVAVIDDQLGAILGPRVMSVLLAVSAITVAVSLTISRIMQIPLVDAWLGSLGLSSAPGVASAQRLAQISRDGE